MHRTRFRQLAWLFASAVAFACSGSDSPTSPDASTVTLAIGQAVVVEGSALVFEDVVGDSRCPQDVDCVWAGDAHLALRWTGQTVELHTNDGPRSVRLGQTTVELLDVAPQPHSEKVILPEDYRATLRLTTG